MIQHEYPVAGTRRHRSPEGPVRTCVGCRKRGLAVDLIRVAAADDGNGGHAVLVDTAGNLSGRGAWLHPDPDCLQAAIRRRAFARALRITGSPDTSAITEHALGDTEEQKQVAKNMSTP
ncbi:YlxR family protein [Mycolicibacterium fallax]|uniref:YlxR family protein n=1 Tax=Mycolicibacterium fallax TaxID=1793 RepID=UPI000A157AA4|nr:YlxR family protein [Mycolicibacterium fallax]BBY96872.1 hypothetical protein MFAL_03390 [Mycolicibacterium fallax]